MWEFHFVKLYKGDDGEPRLYIIGPPESLASVDHFYGEEPFPEHQRWLKDPVPLYLGGGESREVDDG